VSKARDGIIARGAMTEPPPLAGVTHRYVEARGLRVHVAEAGWAAVGSPAWLAAALVRVARDHPGAAGALSMIAFLQRDSGVA
jgi:hypothetical protein